MQCGCRCVNFRKTSRSFQTLRHLYILGPGSGQAIYAKLMVRRGIGKEIYHSVLSLPELSSKASCIRTESHGHVTSISELIMQNGHQSWKKLVMLPDSFEVSTSHSTYAIPRRFLSLDQVRYYPAQPCKSMRYSVGCTSKLNIVTI